MHQDDRLHALLEESYQRITSDTFDDSWWRNVLLAIKHEYVAPDFLKLPHLQEWLRRTEVRADLLGVARARILGERQIEDLPERSAKLYSDLTGEDPRKAIGPTEVVLSILGAGVFARLDSSIYAATAILSAYIGDLRSEIRGQAIARVSEERHSIVSGVARSLLDPILKRRSADVDRSRLEVRAVVERVTKGDLANVDEPTRALVLYWAARLCATKAELVAEASQYLSDATCSDPGIDPRIPRALLLEIEGDAGSAIALLRDGKTADDRSGLFGLIARTRGDAEAIAWFDAQEGHSDIAFATAFGWRVIVVKLFVASRYDQALRLLHAAQVLVNECPDLALVSGVLNAAMLLPPEQRRQALTMDLFHPAMKTMEGPQMEKYRKQAYESFSLAAQLMVAVDLPDQARIARSSLLWLRLTDPELEVQREVREEVRLAMNDPAQAIDLIRYARMFDIEFDPTPLKLHLAQRQRWGGLRGREVVAEFLLCDLEMPPLERAAFIAREEQRLAKEITSAALVAAQVDALIQGGDFARAHQLLDIRKTDLGSGDYERIFATLTARQGGDPRRTLEAAYRRNGDLIDLSNLCNYLWTVSDWRSARPLLGELFARQRTTENAEKLVTVMQRDSTASATDILDFTTTNEDLKNKSSHLKAAEAWALFALGRGQEARKLNDQLLAERSVKRELMLDMNLALQLGDWERFPTIVDREWSGRDRLDAETLMQLATLASEADTSSDRPLELAALAVRKDPANARTLIGAYALGFQLGKEDRVNPEWLNRALELSTSAGPVWKFDIKTLVNDMVPAHRERARKIEQDLLSGVIPLAAAAHGLNTPLSRVLIDLPFHNAGMQDGRPRTMLPVIAGGRNSVEMSAEWTVALDITSLMVLGFLELLPKVLGAFKRIVLPASVMVDLLNERRRVRFHQPSQVAFAEEIRDLIDVGALKSAKLTTKPPTWLTEEVGRELADLLVHAKEVDGRVVRPLPVPKLASFMEKVADLKDYSPLILSCVQFTSALAADGRIDQATYRRARDYLAAHDKSEVANEDRSVLQRPLFLDDLALTYLRSAGVLRVARDPSLDLRIHHSTGAEKGAVARAQREGERLADVINQIRLLLRDSLESGKAGLFVTSRSERDVDHASEQLLEVFPGLSQFLGDTSQFDAVCIDDRFFNRHASVTDRNGRSVSIACLPDVIRFITKAGHLSETEALQVVHRARRAGFSLLPIEKVVLNTYLQQATVETDLVIETDELRVLRQSVMRVRALEALSQPVETRFLDSLRLTCLLEIRELWSDSSISLDHAAALSTWIWHNLVPLPFQWKSTIREASQVMNPADALVQYIAMLLQPMLMLERSRCVAFLEWCDSVVTGPLTIADDDILRQVAERLAADIRRVADQLVADC